MDKKMSGHAAVILANVIFGLGVPVTKYLLEDWTTPMVYMALRCIGAALIFWLIAAFLPKEKVERKDLIVIMLGGLTGFVISQTLTAWALNYTSPVYYSLIATLTPIGTLLLASVFLSEKITGIKLFGVLLGIAGAVLMVVVKWQAEAGSNDLLGISLALLSLLTWVIYLIITSKVSAKYSAVTQMKWTFLVSTIAVLPFAWNEFGQTKLFSGGYGFSEGMMGIGGMAFIVIFATVLGYFMIPYAMKYLKATTVSVYTNLQPIVASFIAIIIGQDIMTWDKPVAAALVLLSAYIVTQKN
ncbi:MAG: EamA family transporter [Bacteroidaceae bacterium]|nr:EamA family transporter [Bacteroidaceae bacterium]MBQ8008192.1 EamA family transporter [Bacteroidaceae bacterium]